MIIQIPRNGSKIGFSNNVDINNFTILSNAPVTNPTGEQANVVSSSDNDSSTGTGIQKVRLVYFDNYWGLNEEIITMSGKTPVSTSAAANIYRIESFEAFQTGSGSFAAGTITLKSLDGFSLFAQIDPNNTIFTRAIHFVSPGKIAGITDIIANCQSSPGVIFMVYITKDNTLDGGGTVLIPDISFMLNAGNSSQISLYSLATCDATKSTQALQIGIAIKGLAVSQIAMASFKYQET